MKKNQVFTVLFPVLLILATGCTTIGTQEMTYLGDETKTANVVGGATHVDLMGIGVNADTYGDMYEKAIKNAFAKAPSGTIELRSIKAFKERKTWPQVLGGAMYAVGLSLLYFPLLPTFYSSSDSSSLSITPSLTPMLLGGVITMGGALVMGINTYDFVVIGEPVQ